ncbi:MAG: TIGR02217 family protein [Shinella sp.]|nr:MAG: TIGR02217 family protein [Shinella sp.]
MADGFHEVRFPLRLSLNVTGGPVRRTDIVNLSNGREARNRRWRDSRRAYDAGSGVRSVTDLYEVLSFFEARSGGLHGFRFRDPVDGKSSAPDRAVTPFDQVIGEGDGERATFQLAKTYGDAAGEWRRVIAKPVAGTVRLAVDGVELAASAFTCDTATGLVTIDEDYIPFPGALVQAGFEFDVPVRFDAERIDLNLEAFRAGRIPTIPLIEILP